MTTLWATADLHFGHKHVIDMCKRPFKDTKSMAAGLIERWNDNVAKTDIVYLLGDVSFLTPSQTRPLLDRLHGSIVLIFGNHDDKRMRKLSRWTAVRQTMSILYDGYDLHMSHHPPMMSMIGSPGMRDLWLHGHLHSKTPGTLPMHDVGVDANGWEPVRLDDIVAKARQREQSLATLKNLIGG